jgi:hypothetical protein
LLVPYAPAAVTGAGELAWIVPGATDATNGELAALLTEEVLTGNKGWETWVATGEGTPGGTIRNDVWSTFAGAEVKGEGTFCIGNRGSCGCITAAIVGTETAGCCG